MICLALDYYLVNKKIDTFYLLVFTYIHFLRVLLLMDTKTIEPFHINFGQNLHVL